jgi:hypothetical protein
MEDKTLVVTAPPPPSEVKIRTMRSDLESMRKSGGGAPKFQNVTVSGLSLEKVPPQAAEVAPVAIQRPSAPQSQQAPIASPVTPVASSNGTSTNHFMGILIVAIVGILAIAGVGYFAYTIFAK